MDNKPLRLQKYLADRGVASRRTAEEMIAEGRVTVDGEVASIGRKVTPGKETVVVDGATVRHRPVRSLTLALHKPKGFLCSNRDPHHDRTLFDLLPPEFRGERLFCVGRLDKESEGLVILTSDGGLAQRVSHPSHRVIKRYRVELDKPFDSADIPKLLKGIVWEGERLKAEKVVPNPHKHASAKRSIEIHLEHGKKREIRRLLFALGYNVTRLQRFQIGRLTVRGLSRGAFKVLGPDDINRLFG